MNRPGVGKKGGGKAKAPSVSSALTELHELAKTGDVEALKAHKMWAQAGSEQELTRNLLFVDGLKRTPLHLAAYFGKAEAVSAILEVCPDSAERQAQDGFLPAHFAAQQGHLEALRTLVRRQGEKVVFCALLWTCVLVISVISISNYSVRRLFRLQRGSLFCCSVYIFVVSRWNSPSLSS